MGLGDVAGIGGAAGADDLGVDVRVAGAGGLKSFEGEHGGTFAEGHAVAVRGERAALRGGDDAHAVPGAEEAEGEGGFVAARDGGVDHAGADHLEGESDGVGAGGAGGGDVEGGTCDLEVDRDVAGSGGGHGADDGKGMDAGVAGIELVGFGLFGLAATARAADDDGDFFWCVVVGQLGLGGRLAGGYDSEVYSSVGGGEDAGVEVLAGVEVFDGGGSGEAEALGFIVSFAGGGFGVGREGRDAGGAGEERGAEVRYGVADGGDTSEAGDLRHDSLLLPGGALVIVDSSLDPALPSFLLAVFCG